MDEQLFQILLAVFGGLITIIGFFIVWTLTGIKETLKAHEEKLTEHSTMITTNRSNIEKNSALDKEVRSSMDKEIANLSEKLKDFRIQIGKDLDAHRESINTYFTNLNKSQTP